VTEYGQLRSALQAAARKQQGSLAVRDLSPLVPRGQVVETENLTTLLVVVSKAARGEWLTQYESLAEFVVPRSSAAVAEDQDYLAFTVVLFRRVVDSFKTAARSKGFQVGRMGGRGGGGEGRPYAWRGAGKGTARPLRGFRRLRPGPARKPSAIGPRAGRPPPVAAPLSVAERLS
jgi:hypothetical protein